MKYFFFVQLATKIFKLRLKDIQIKRKYSILILIGYFETGQFITDF